MCAPRHKSLRLGWGTRVHGLHVDCGFGYYARLLEIARPWRSCFVSYVNVWSGLFGCWRSLTLCGGCGGRAAWRVASHRLRLVIPRLVRTYCKLRFIFYLNSIQ